MVRLYVVPAAAAALLCGCSGDKETASSENDGRVVFRDCFDRESLGPDWRDTSGGAYEIRDGALRAAGARNKPLWLARKLPRDARVEFTARSESPAVDIKVELFGDGASKAEALSYTATSYVLILGGWNNSRSVIARMDEHGKDRKERARPRAAAGRTYRFSITRRGGLVSWLLDGEPFLEMDDPEPLGGPGHEHFAFNDWESEVFFDDLVIREL